MSFKVIIILFILCIFSFPANSQEFIAVDSIPDSFDCIVLKNNYIIKGEIKRWEQGGLFTKKKAVIVTPDGTKWDYFINNIAYMRFNGYIVKPLPQRPKSKDKNLFFMIRIMFNNNYAIYKYEKVIQSDYGPTYDWKYYLYQNNEFQENVNNKNYKRILEKHFSDCDYIKEVIDSKKNFFWDDKLSKVAINYNKDCK